MWSGSGDVEMLQEPAHDCAASGTVLELPRAWYLSDAAVCGYRGAKLQQRFNKLQADTAKKQEQSAAQLAELQRKLEDMLASSSGTDSAALQEALDRVS